jgi:hypothetical protein
MAYEASFELVDAGQFGLLIPGWQHQHSTAELRKV